jgi:hypothetical protein
MSPENKTKKKENWFSRLSRNLFKKASTDPPQSESIQTTSESVKTIPEPQKLSSQQTQEFIQQKLLGELTKLKASLVIESSQSFTNENEAKKDTNKGPKLDEFDINRFNQPYNGLNIVSPVIKPHSTGSGMIIPNQGKNSPPNKEPVQQTPVMEIRKNFLKELVRLKKVVNETEIESDEDLEEKNLLSKKLKEELSQFKKSIKDAPTEEEKKILLEGDWDVW